MWWSMIWDDFTLGNDDSLHSKFWDDYTLRRASTHLENSMDGSLLIANPFCDNECLIPNSLFTHLGSIWLFN